MVRGIFKKMLLKKQAIRKDIRTDGLTDRKVNYVVAWVLNPYIKLIGSLCLSVPKDLCNS